MKSWGSIVKTLIRGWKRICLYYWYVKHYALLSLIKNKNWYRVSRLGFPKDVLDWRKVLKNPHIIERARQVVDQVRQKVPRKTRCNIPVHKFDALVWITFCLGLLVMMYVVNVWGMDLANERIARTVAKWIFIACCIPAGLLYVVLFLRLVVDAIEGLSERFRRRREENSGSTEIEQ